MSKKILCLLLTLLLCLQVLPCAEAETQDDAAGLPNKAEYPRTLSISTAAELLEFAAACRLDSYSEGLAVTLTANIDLTGLDFSPIPVFGGYFDGAGYTVTGLTLVPIGSVQGFFRYLTADAVVTDLTLRGSVDSAGSRNQVGGLAGSNAGRISGCSFVGSVVGNEQVGGLVGVNLVSGIIEDCEVHGVLQGSHFVGGLVGVNAGVVRRCINDDGINTTAQQNTVDMTDITLESMTGSELAAAVTDVGGIAGINTGVLRECTNQGAIGYAHMGYNVGGIAGAQSGTVIDCRNLGTVQGRKEVGGIVGQLEPAALLQYDEDTLQALGRQLDSVNATVDRAAADVQGLGNALTGQVGEMQQQLTAARQALELLEPDHEDNELQPPDADRITAARSALAGSLAGIGQSLQTTAVAAGGAADTLSQELSVLQKQLAGLSSTLENGPTAMGGSITDVSDADTEADLTGKLQGCSNAGRVTADLNAGGIAGAMSLENDLDPEEDWILQGERSLYFEGELRCVVLDCENTGTVAVKRAAAGGIVGLQTMGLVRSCRSSCIVEAPGARYIGGIAGQSLGYIRSCAAKCRLAGDRYVGGIAGSAALVTDCRSLPQITGGSEQLGAVLGGREENTRQDEAPIANNVYLAAEQDIGGIDGISYAGMAQPLPESEFLAQEGLESLFGSSTVSFVGPDGSSVNITVPAGGAVRESDIPPVPQKAGSVGYWAGLDTAQLTDVLHDMRFEAAYLVHSSVLAGSLAGPDGRPMLLAQGNFEPAASLAVMADADWAVQTLPLAEGESLLGSWQLELTGPGVLTGARLLWPQHTQNVPLQVWRMNGEGLWTAVTPTVDGSYLVFPLEEGCAALALVQGSPVRWPLHAGLTGGAVLLVGAAVLLAHGAKKRRAGRAADATE